VALSLAKESASSLGLSKFLTIVEKLDELVQALVKLSMIEARSAFIPFFLMIAFCF
jgi:hypothetical protein